MLSILQGLGRQGWGSSERGSINALIKELWKAFYLYNWLSDPVSVMR